MILQTPDLVAVVVFAFSLGLALGWLVFSPRGVRVLWHRRSVSPMEWAHQLAAKVESWNR